MTDWSKAPAFYAEQGIPKVRWMFPGEAYRAIIPSKNRVYKHITLYIYVINDMWVAAFRDKTLTDQLGILKLQSFIKTRKIDIDEPPKYKLNAPLSMKFGWLEEQGLLRKMGEPMSDEIVIENTESVIEVKVSILPPEPPRAYEQLVLF